MNTANTQYNLDKDRRVLGKKWLSTYGGWFSDENNFNRFIKAVVPYLPNGDVRILYVASASGLLGEKLLKKLKRGSLTILDASKKHLMENKNNKTKKIVSDMLSMKLQEKYDVIIMRSSLDYLPSKSMQIKALRNIQKCLSKKGLFVNQPAYIRSKRERDAVTTLYNTLPQIGMRLFQSNDLSELYEKAGLTKPKIIGEGNVMHITEKDHQERYNIGKKEIKIAKGILEESGLKHFITKSGYSLQFEFPIFLARKKRRR